MNDNQGDLAKEVGKQVRNARSKEAVVLFLIILGAIVVLFLSVR